MTQRRVPWTRQPQFPAQINSGNRLARGLLRLVVPTRPGFDAVSAQPLTASNGAAIRTGVAGVAYDFNGTTTGLNVAATVAGAYTLFAVAETDTTSGTRNIASFGSGTSYAVQLRQDGTAWSLYQSDNILNPVAQETGAVTANSVVVLAGTWDGINTGRLYRGGVQRATQTFPSFKTNNSFRVGHDNFGAKQAWDGAIYLCALWERELSALEIADLSQNPWQLFAPRRIWVPVSLAGGGASGTVAYTNAADTSNASGTTTVTGTLARTNAADTSAASGTTTVTGTVARTNANDTPTASGTTTVTGTSATTNANDTATASGTVSDAVSGMSATTNANDTSTASGTTTVVGTSATTNAADTPTAAGTTTVVGTSATTNANDTATASGVAGAISGTVAVTNADDRGDAEGWVNEPPSDTRRRGGGNRFVLARKRLPSAYLIDWLTNEEPSEETKRVIQEIKAGRPIERLDPPKVEKQISPEELAQKLIPRRVINLANVLPVEQTQLIRKAIRIAQEKDDEDILMLL